MNKVTNKTSKRKIQNKYSKHGCIQCKKSHIKCSEEKPICNNCRKSRTKKCSYLTQFISKIYSNDSSINTKKFTSVNLLSKINDPNNNNTTTFVNNADMFLNPIIKFDTNLMNTPKETDIDADSNANTDTTTIINDNNNDNNDIQIPNNISISDKFNALKIFSKSDLSLIFEKNIDDNNNYSYIENNYQFININKLLLDNNIPFKDAFDFNSAMKNDPICKLLKDSLSNYDIDPLSAKISLDLNDSELWNFSIDSYIDLISERFIIHCPKDHIKELCNMVVRIGLDFKTVKNAIMYVNASAITYQYSKNPKTKLLCLIWKKFINNPSLYSCFDSLYLQANSFTLKLFDWLLLCESTILLFTVNFRTTPLSSNWRSHINEFYKSFINCEAMFFKKTTDCSSGEKYLLTPVFAGLTYFQNIECITLFTSNYGGSFETFDGTKDFLYKKILMNKEQLIKYDINLISGYHVQLNSVMTSIALKLKEILINSNINICGFNILLNSIPKRSPLKIHLKSFSLELIEKLKKIKIDENNIKLISGNNEQLNKRLLFNNIVVRLSIEVYLNTFFISSNNDSIETGLQELVSQWEEIIKEVTIISNVSFWTLFIGIIVTIKRKDIMMFSKILRLIYFYANSGNYSITGKILLNKVFYIRKNTKLLEFIPEYIQSSIFSEDNIEDIFYDNDTKQEDKAVLDYPII